jgi:hypothetical protein
MISTIPATAIQATTRTRAFIVVVLVVVGRATIWSAGMVVGPGDAPGDAGVSGR